MSLMALETHMILLTSILFSIQLHFVTSQDCYYPNGDVADGDGACGQNLGSCCPFNWECLSNGLCYLENVDFYGRYTCTDANWDGDTCPQICTHNNTASGNEAVLQCADDAWCCDGDRSFNCCEQAGTNYFTLASGTSITVINSIATATSASQASTASSQVPSTTSVASTILDSSTQPTTAATTSTIASSTSQQTSLTTTSDGSFPTVTTPEVITTNDITSTASDGSIIYATRTVTAAAAPDASSTSPATTKVHDTTRLPLILGISLGLPALILLLSILAVLFLRRHRRQKNIDNLQRANTSDHHTAPDLDKMDYMYAHLPPSAHAPELDSFPVADTGRHSAHKSELAGSSPYRDWNPGMGSVARGSTATAPPGYTPGDLGSPESGVREIIREEEPAELWGCVVPRSKAAVAGHQEEGDGVI